MGNLDMSHLLGGFVRQLAAELEVADDVAQVQALLHRAGLLLGLPGVNDTENDDASGAGGGGGGGGFRESSKLPQLTADCLAAAKSASPGSPPSETLQVAFFNGPHFETLADLLLHHVAPDWLVCFSASKRTMLLESFFRAAPPASVLLAAAPALVSARGDGEEEGLGEPRATQRLAERLLVTCLLEQRPGGTTGLHQLAQQCGDDSMAGKSDVQNLSEVATNGRKPWREEAVQLAGLLASIPDRAAPSAPSILRSPKFFTAAMGELLKAAQERWERHYWQVPIEQASNGSLPAVKGCGQEAPPIPVLVDEGPPAGSGARLKTAAEEVDGTFLLVGSFIARLCRRGHADIAAAQTCAALLPQIHHSFSAIDTASEADLGNPSTAEGSKALRPIVHPSLVREREALLGARWHAVAASVKDSHAAERWLEALLREMARRRVEQEVGIRVLWALFGRLLWTSGPIRHLFTERFLLRRVLPRVCLRWLLPFAVLDPPPMPSHPSHLYAAEASGGAGGLEEGSWKEPRAEEEARREVVGRLVAAWASADFVRSAPQLQQAYVTAAVAAGVKGLTKGRLESTGGLLPALLQGVSARLESPLIPIRRMGQKVATAFSTVIDPTNPLIFEEYAEGGEDSDAEEGVDQQGGRAKGGLQTKLLSEDRRGDSLEGLTEEREGEGERGGGGRKLPGRSDEEKAERRRRRRERREKLAMEEDDPDVVVALGGSPGVEGSEEGSLGGSESESERESGDESGSEASLEPYDLEDDEADLEGEKVPTQLRACAAALRKGDDPDAVERALGVAESLIRAKPDELADIAAELAQALIHVQCGAVAVEGEEGLLEERQHQALQALLVEAAGPTLGVLTRAVFSAHVDISQRLFILDVMADGARELAFSPSTETVEDRATSHSVEWNHHRSKRSLVTELPSSSGRGPWYGPGGDSRPFRRTGRAPWSQVPAPVPLPGGGESMINWAHRYERELPPRLGSRQVGKTRRWGQANLGSGVREGSVGSSEGFRDGGSSSSSNGGLGTRAGATVGAGSGRAESALAEGEATGGLSQKWARENRFAPLAPAFMLPLMRDYDKVSQGVDWVGRDFVVLGRLLCMLGTCMECVGRQPQAPLLAAALLDLLQARAVCGHPEAYVRRGVLYAAMQVMLALPPVYVVVALAGGDAAIAAGLEWVREWAMRVSETDPDDDCAAMAGACLHVHRELALRAVQAMEESAAAPQPSLPLPSSKRGPLIVPL